MGIGESMITVKVDQHGTITLGPDVLQDLKPNTAFTVRRDGHAVILEPLRAYNPETLTLSPEERAKRFEAFVRRASVSVGLPDDATRRESIYED